MSLSLLRNLFGVRAEADCRLPAPTPDCTSSRARFRAARGKSFAMMIPIETMKNNKTFGKVVYERLRHMVALDGAETWNELSSEEQDFYQDAAEDVIAYLQEYDRILRYLSPDQIQKMQYHK